ncbi:hypothetical protein ACPC54_32625 [Kitasatospora sp. NPDC094028]
MTTIQNPTRASVDRPFLRRSSLAAVGVVLAGALTTASGPWCSAQWKAGWLITGVGVAAGVALWRRRVRQIPETDRKSRASTDVAHLLAVLLWIGSALFALCLSGWFHGRDLDGTATLKVPALTARCESAGEHGQNCYYSYVVNGREYLSKGQYGGSVPVTLRVDPAHPGDLERTDSAYQFMWVGIAFFALVAGASAWGLAGSERGLARLRLQAAGTPDREETT